MYDIVENDISKNSFSVTVTCASGFSAGSGGVSVTVCADSGDAYAVSGCEETLAATTDGVSRAPAVATALMVVATGRYLQA